MDYQVCHAVEAFALLTALSWQALQTTRKKSFSFLSSINNCSLTDLPVSSHITRTISHVTSDAVRLLRPGSSLRVEGFCMTQAEVWRKSRVLALPQSRNERTFYAIQINRKGRSLRSTGLRPSVKTPHNRDESVMSGGKYRQEAPRRQHQSDAFLKTGFERVIARLARPPPDP